jgi:hypothetical protein
MELQLNKFYSKDNTLNAAYEDRVMYVTINYYKYIAYTFTAILLMLLFLRFSASEQQTGGGNNCSNMKYFFFFIIGVIGFIYFKTNF